MRRTLFPAAAAALLTLGARPAPAQDAGSAPPTRAPAAESRPRSRDHVTLEEISASTETDLFSFLYATRASWLRARGQVSFRGAEVTRVYVNGMLAGGPAALRQIQLHLVREVEHLDGRAATMRFGADHGGGAILVTTR